MHAYVRLGFEGWFGKEDLQRVAGGIRHGDSLQSWKCGMHMKAGWEFCVGGRQGEKYDNSLGAAEGAPAMSMASDTARLVHYTGIIPEAPVHVECTSSSAIFHMLLCVHTS